MRRWALFSLTVALFAQNSGQGPFRPGSTSPAPGTSLAIYAVKGPQFGVNTVVMVDSDQLLESVIGSPTNCVLVDGSSQPCGSGGGGGSVPNFSDNEVPTGSVNGSNTVFDLANAPSPSSSLHFYRNGVRLKATSDFTLSGNVITFANGEVPQSGDTLLADYRY